MFSFRGDFGAPNMSFKEMIRSKRFWYQFFRLFLIVFGVGLVLMIILFAWYSKDLPSPTKVVRREGFASRIYDRNGELLYDLYHDQKRQPVTDDLIPDYLKKATVAVEDKDFYNHSGFDPMAPFRIIKNLFYFKKLTGGSTLTQQLVKNVLLTSEVSVTRKIKEFILAVQIESKYKKNDILLMYLNEAPYGGTAWGVGTAAEQYFGKAVKDLGLAESAILAGLPQRPNVYSPFSSNPTAYVARTEHVLNRMVEDGYIDAETKNMTMEEVKNYKFYENTSKLSAPHFVFWIKELLSERYGEDVAEGGGLKVSTTLDIKLQNQVQQIVSDQIDKSEKLLISNGAALVMDPRDGQVLAMVGSRGYNSDKTSGQFNVVTQGLRQPGSAIKPITYLMALRKGYTAASMIMDTPVSFPVAGQRDYSPQNYTGKFLGPMSLREALGNSINTIAVKMLARVGVDNMLQQAYDMGVSTLEPTAENMKKFGFAVTLGGADVKMIDLASAYSAFANGGYKIEPVGILKVEDKDGRVLEEFHPSNGKKVMSPQEAFIISNILSDNNARSLTFGAVNSLAISNYQVAVKTGTTNEKKDNWTIGWTPNLLASVWVGNNDSTPMGKVASGVSGAAPIWRQIMLYALPKREKQDFPIPDKIVNISVDKLSGYGVHDGFESKTEYFIDGTQTNISDPIHLKLKICRDKTGLATPEDVANGNFDEKEYFNFKEEDPVSVDGRNRWQEGIDGWINSQENKDMYAPPFSYCRDDGAVGVSFDQPGDHSTQGNEVSVKISTSSLKKITEVKLWVDGSEVKTWNERPFEGNFNMSTGPHTLKVRAVDKDGASNEREIRIGVNVAWDWSPSPTPTITPIPSPVLIPTLFLSPTPIISPTVTVSP
ncbi:MAG: Penicillin-binding protein, 1A family [Candidatus Shapirobacteria bacterium GW2011_GWF2_37_20]|nr:MAG: Penicillin-binding protein, 1A family [Candidatus Shapirobacteria bacterium GW2011_GWF2_37_20]